MTSDSTPVHILQIGMGFWASKTLLSAVELGLFTALDGQSMTADQLGDQLQLHERSRHDFLDALVSLKMLDRDGDGPEALYRNTAETGTFLDKSQASYIGGILEMANSRLYGFWNNLTEALRTGLPQNEIKEGGDFFGALYADESRLEEFMLAMQGVQMGAFLALADKVDFSSAATLCDLGGANGALCAVIAQQHPHLSATIFDLPQVVSLAERYLAKTDVGDRVTVVGGDFFTDELPHADVLVMGNILHDWDEEQKKTLIGKAYEALHEGGRLIAIENVIDDARRDNTFGLLMSLNMLIELPGGFDYSGAQFDSWCKGAGFARTEVVPLAGPTSAAIAYK
jgi:predicted O-methyltransferase YrrM